MLTECKSKPKGNLFLFGNYYIDHYDGSWIVYEVTKGMISTKGKYQSYTDAYNQIEQLKADAFEKKKHVEVDTQELAKVAQGLINHNIGCTIEAYPDYEYVIRLHSYQSGSISVTLRLNDEFCKSGMLRLCHYYNGDLVEDKYLDANEALGYVEKNYVA